MRSSGGYRQIANPSLDCYHLLTRKRA